MDNETRNRIEKEAIKYVINATGYQVLPEHDHWKEAYISGSISEHSRITELLNTMDEYIALLSKGLVESAAFLDVHGWKYSQSDIDKGVELRAKIQALKGKQQ